jgi:hypothetical protein
MASRQEEKEARREQRLAAERDAEAAAARKKRLGLATAAVLTVALIAAIVIVVVSSSGGSKKPKPGQDGTSAKLPAVQIADLGAAAKAAGCTVQDFTAGPHDRDHVAGKVKYKSNPPSFGPHNQTPASDGDYVGQGPPAAENLVHALEHGRVEIQYRPRLPKAQVDQLEAVFNEKAGPFTPGQYALVFENRTGMPYAVGAAAWTHVLGCKTFNPKVFDAIRAFRTKYTLKGPELINAPE